MLLMHRMGRCIEVAQKLVLLLLSCQYEATGGAMYMLMQSKVSQLCEAQHLQSTGDIEKHAGHKQLPRIMVQVLLNQAVGAGRGVPQGLPGVGPSLQKRPGFGRLLG